MTNAEPIHESEDEKENDTVYEKKGSGHWPIFVPGHATATVLQDVQVYEMEAAEVDEEERCGIGCFKPEFLQPLRNMKVFLLVFIITGISQGMFYSYWNMSLSSIEKRFQIPSQTTGLISAINDVSHIAVVLFVAHFCGRGHRPRWLAVGKLTVGVAVLTFATPELFAPRWDAESMRVTTNTSLSFDKEMCLTNSQAQQITDQCVADAPSQVNKNVWAFVLLGLAQVLLGIGTTAPIVLAMPFIDDNVKTKNTPVYFALGFAGRFIGPLVGVFLGSFCLSTYIDLSQTPNIAQTDPRWMGAWYLGFIIIGTLICLLSTLYLFFPARVPASRGSKLKAKPVAKITSNGKAYAGVPTNNQLAVRRNSAPAKETLKEKFAGIPRDLKRLLVNKIFMCRVMNDCIDMLVVSGYFSFAPKYLEYHFRMSPAKAGKFNGLASILAVAGGATIGGLIIKKMKFQPKHVALMICISSFLISICYFFLMMVTCEPRLLFSHPGPDKMLIVDSACTNGCNCAGRPFSPVCHIETGVSYYSPCHAGCSEVFAKENQTKYYSNCTCLANQSWKFQDPIDIHKSPSPSFSSLFASDAPRNASGNSTGPTVKRGFCEGGCGGFWVYVIISTSFKFVGAFPFSGNQMLSFRIVDPDLKSLSKAVRTLLASLFAFIPGPIIMGALIDSACRLWNTQACGQKGACLVYDLDSLRIKMHLYVAIVKTVACVMDVYVFFKVKNMKFDREPEPAPEEATPKPIATGSVKDLTAFD